MTTSSLKADENCSDGDDNNLHLIIEFTGGAELLFDKKKIHHVKLPLFISDNNKTDNNTNNKKQWTIRTLLVWIRNNLLKERPELFIQGDSVRPGILVLINDVDWELLGDLNYELKQNDNVLFVSTLHGG
ncbi:unnamed protein product [Didymodactylos carnosus]|uniref:Ubiquitin-related modifier 1 homolog n=2 Tax=Didymodactylos carnosus TaxID=1234261 RepID=A0A813ZND5_9BILA|nr:unnamed protein product [Didymodactylos carnosus]CAF3682984.1 unnamed protein product [Didymodactylos carnosus]